MLPAMSRSAAVVAERHAVVRLHARARARVRELHHSTDLQRLVTSTASARRHHEIHPGSSVLSAAGADITLGTRASVITIMASRGWRRSPCPVRADRLLNSRHQFASLAAQSWFVEPFLAPDSIAPGQLNILVSSYPHSVAVLNRALHRFATDHAGYRRKSFNQMAALYSRTAGGTSIGSFWSNAVGSEYVRIR